jgi:hypothetical protein
MYNTYYLFHIVNIFRQLLYKKGTILQHLSFISEERNDYRISQFSKGRWFTAHYLPCIFRKWPQNVYILYRTVTQMMIHPKNKTKGPGAKSLTWAIMPNTCILHILPLNHLADKLELFWINGILKRFSKMSSIEADVHIFYHIVAPHIVTPGDHKLNNNNGCIYIASYHP